MLLAIDIGNTNIVIGCISDKKIHFIARLATEKNLSKEQYCIQIKNILEIYNVPIEKIKDSIISSVVPPVLPSVLEAVNIITGKKPFIANQSLNTGLNILMDNPKQLGSDLIVNAVAGIKEHSPPLIIIDMGTATTISVIDKEKNYIGGNIIPGVKISLNALSSKTAQLPYIDLEYNKKIIGKNTIDCMQSGIILGTASMLDGMIERIEQELLQKATVIATGGIASHIIPYCKKDIIYDNNLMLKGLLYLYNKNFSK